MIKHILTAFLVLAGAISRRPACLHGQASLRTRNAENEAQPIKINIAQDSRWAGSRHRQFWSCPFPHRHRVSLSRSTRMRTATFLLEHPRSVSV